MERAGNRHYAFKLHKAEENGPSRMTVIKKTPDPISTSLTSPLFWLYLECTVHFPSWERCSVAQR